MKALLTFMLPLLLVGCVHTSSSDDFVQGGIRITPPIHGYSTKAVLAIQDGGTLYARFTDANGRVFDYYIDHRIGTKTPGAIYLNAYPGDGKSVRVKNEAEFKQKLRFDELPDLPMRI